MLEELRTWMPGVPKKEGIDDGPVKNPTSVRLGEFFLEKIDRIAKATGRPLADTIRFLIRLGMEEHFKQHPDHAVPDETTQKKAAKK